MTRDSGMSGTGFLIAALLTGAFGVGVVVGGYMLLSRPSLSPDVSAAIASATGRVDPTAPKPEIDDASWTDEDLASCKLQATQAAEEASKRKLAAVSSDRVGLGGVEPEVMERATYLLCGASHKPRHLCNDYWRGWFIDALKEYAGEFRAVSQSAYWTKVEVAEQARRESNQGAWTLITNDLDQTARDMGKLHDGIAASFRTLIEDGIIDPNDFGIFLGLGIPPEIGAMIGDARPLRNLCG